MTLPEKLADPQRFLLGVELVSTRGTIFETRASKSVAFAEALARQRGLKQLFALSTQAYKYLQIKGGYCEATPDILPLLRQKKYESAGRQAKVLVKALN